MILFQHHKYREYMSSIYTFEECSKTRTASDLTYVIILEVGCHHFQESQERPFSILGIHHTNIQMPTPGGSLVNFSTRTTSRG